MGLYVLQKACSLLLILAILELEVQGITIGYNNTVSYYACRVSVEEHLSNTWILVHDAWMQAFEAPCTSFCAVSLIL